MAKLDTLKNYTTEISVEKTIGEIIDLLFQKGGESVSVKRDKENKHPIAILFSFPFPMIENQFINYRIEANWQGALSALETKSDVASRFCNEPQARRTAWRTILYWIQHQIAMCEMMQGQIEQMFFGHAIDSKTNNFVFADLIGFKQKQLAEGKAAAKE